MWFDADSASAYAWLGADLHSFGSIFTSAEPRGHIFYSFVGWSDVALVLPKG
jgi:hypothetical protein